ncbi:MAG: ABC transporter ATP-binding protein/permease [Actinomycetia bacterium]|nr:ABC transporter ATP-binding protein/permease [Actinomycetes bacterium]
MAKKKSDANQPEIIDIDAAAAPEVPGTAAETAAGTGSGKSGKNKQSYASYRARATQNRRGPGRTVRGAFGGGGRGGSGRPGAPVEKAKDFKGSLKKLLRYLGRYRLALVFVAVFAIASTVFSIVGPKILGTATTELFEGIMGQIAGSGAGPDFTAIANTLVFLVGLYLLSACFQFVQGWVMTRVSNNVCFNLRRDINEKISRLPLAYFDRVATGDVMSHFTNDVDAIQQNLSQSVTQVITSIAMLVGILAMMFSISWVMALIAIVTLPVSAAVIALIVKRSQKHFVAQQDYLGEVNGLVEESYGGHAIVKAFNGEAAAVADFDRSNSTLYNSAWRANFLSGLMMPIMNIISNLGYVVVCIIGASLAIRGSITVGDIQAFIQYMRNFQQPIVQVSQISNILQQTMAGAERIFAFLEEDEIVPDVADSEAVKPAEVEASVRFDHVCFGYDPEAPVIRDFSATVKPGEKIAIVGHTGAGKTTVVKLLERFYDVDSGAILIGGHDIRSFKRNDLRSLTGMVLQDTWLFNGSVADNIRYGKLDATDEEVREAARIAQADHFIRTLPAGYQMELNEEATNVSLGQKQLLTIARAVLHNPQILILDEATSSIDTRTELLIQKAMDNLMAGRTSFIIAHRLSTIKNADLILVMENGDIVEQGSHAELLARGKAYAELYNSQFDVGEG